MFRDIGPFINNYNVYCRITGILFDKSLWKKNIDGADKECIHKVSIEREGERGRGEEEKMTERK